VIQTQPTNDAAYYNLGIKYFEKGLVDLAVQSYQHALALNPGTTPRDTISNWPSSPVRCSSDLDSQSIIAPPTRGRRGRKKEMAVALVANQSSLRRHRVGGGGFGWGTSSRACSPLCFLLLALLLLGLSSCAMYRSDRCFIENARYQKMREIFVKTGSYQQVEQATDAEGWSTCERNELSYRLRKDFDLERYPDRSEPEPEFSP